jgi:DNA modification methylase
MNGKQRLARLIADKQATQTTHATRTVQATQTIQATRAGGGKKKKHLKPHPQSWTPFEQNPPVGTTCFHIHQTTVYLICGDCTQILKDTPPAWVDCIITDPGAGTTQPYPGWVNKTPSQQVFQTLLHVTKPGGHAAIFAGHKTFGQIAVNAENAGWEIRDTLLWLYPKGMPMSIDVGQAINRKTGGEGQPYFRTITSLPDDQRQAWLENQSYNPWNGWGTELRPSWEPILLLRRPPQKTLADNILKWQTGAINIDETRIPAPPRPAIQTHIPPDQKQNHGHTLQKHQTTTGTTTLGRWPTNTIIQHHPNCTNTCHPDCPVQQLKNQAPNTQPERFFYTPKATRHEKDLGQPPKNNKHKNIKPLAICEWIHKLITPPEAVVLDPFAGTCTTGLAAARNNSAVFVGIDIEQQWLNVGETRLKNVDLLDLPG